MDKNTVDYYASVLAVQVEVDAMKVENFRRDMLEQAHAYSERDFWDKAQEIRDLINYWNI